VGKRQRYPKGLAGEEISLHARIFAIADCFDALVSDDLQAGMPINDNATPAGRCWKTV